MSSILIHFQCVHLQGSRGHDLEILIFTVRSVIFFTCFRPAVAFLSRDVVVMGSQWSFHSTCKEQPGRSKWRGGGTTQTPPLVSSLALCHQSPSHPSLEAVDWIVCGWRPRLFKLSGFSVLFRLCMCLCNGEERSFRTNPVYVFFRLKCPAGTDFLLVKAL